MARKPKITALKERVWKTFSQYIRLRDSDEYGYCYCCSCGTRGYWKQMQAGHYAITKHNATKFDERNVNAQCPRCNKWESGNPPGYTAFLQRKYGVGIVEELDMKSKEIKQFEEDELLKLERHYKAEVKKLLAERRLSE